AARCLAIDLLAAIDATDSGWTITARTAAAILDALPALAAARTLPALPDVWPLATTLPDVRTLAALADVGTLPLPDAALRSIGDLAAELLALLGAGAVLPELLAGRRVTIGNAAAMAGIVLPAIVVGVAAAVEVAVDVDGTVAVDVDVTRAARPVPA